MAEVEIGIGKSGRRAYGFDDIAIVPSRRTRDPEDVDIAWEIDAYQLRAPAHGRGDGRRGSPATAIEIGRLGGVGVLNLEGLWTRYEDPEPLFEEISKLDTDKATARMQQIYAEPIKPDLIVQRIREIKDAGVTSAASLTPQRVEQFADRILEAELDLFVIQGTVVSAEHVSKTVEPLNLKRFIREFEIPVIVGGCASYQAALHLMRTGAVGILVGVGPGNACTTRGVLGIGVPQATAIADAAGARMRHLDETGVYVHVIADGGMSTRRRHRQGHRLRRRLGDDRVAARRRARGAGQGLPLGHGHLPPHVAARCPRAHRADRHHQGGADRPRQRERRPPQPVRCTAHRHGDVRLRVGEGVPEGRGDGRAGAADRGQAAPAVAERRHGSLMTPGNG